jgi:hypothetical protein
MSFRYGYARPETGRTIKFSERFVVDPELDPKSKRGEQPSQFDIQ